jgi:hypothetical protein
VSGIAYEGFKGLLDALNTIGSALPPLKVAAAGLRSVMTVINVRYSWQQVTAHD